MVRSGPTTEKGFRSRRRLCLTHGHGDAPPAPVVTTLDAGQRGRMRNNGVGPFRLLDRRPRRRAWVPDESLGSRGPLRRDTHPPEPDVLGPKKSPSLTSPQGTSLPAPQTRTPVHWDCTSQHPRGGVATSPLGTPPHTVENTSPTDPIFQERSEDTSNCPTSFLILSCPTTCPPPPRHSQGGSSRPH